MFQLLQIMFLWTFMNSFLCTHMFLILLGFVLDSYFTVVTNRPDKNNKRRNSLFYGPWFQRSIVDQFHSFRSKVRQDVLLEESSSGHGNKEAERVLAPPGTKHKP